MPRSGTSAPPADAQGAADIAVYVCGRLIMAWRGMGEEKAHRRARRAANKGHHL
jgi:hypothetical protein